MHFLGHLLFLFPLYNSFCGDLRSQAEIRGSWTDMYEWYVCGATHKIIFIHFIRRAKQAIKSVSIPTSPLLIVESITFETHLVTLGRSKILIRFSKITIILYQTSHFALFWSSTSFDLSNFQNIGPIDSCFCGTTCTCNCFRIFVARLLPKPTTGRAAHSRGSIQAIKN